MRVVKSNQQNLKQGAPISTRSVETANHHNEKPLYFQAAGNGSPIAIAVPFVEPTEGDKLRKGMILAVFGLLLFSTAGFAKRNTVTKISSSDATASAYLAGSGSLAQIFGDSITITAMRNITGGRHDGTTLLNIGGFGATSFRNGLLIHTFMSGTVYVRDNTFTGSFNDGLGTVRLRVDFSRDVEDGDDLSFGQQCFTVDSQNSLTQVSCPSSSASLQGTLNITWRKTDTLETLFEGHSRTRQGGTTIDINGSTTQSSASATAQFGSEEYATASDDALVGSNKNVSMTITQN